MATLRTPDGAIVARLEVAASRRARRQGLRGRRALEEGRGLLLRPCRAVHSFGVAFAFDAVFLDRRGRVLYVKTLRPWRLSRVVWGARACVELAAGSATRSRIVPGTLLELGAGA